MRERSELARKGIARGRSVVVLAYAGGVLFVAENPSRSLQKVSELYDRVGFAAVGRFNEFDNLRRGGIQFADTRGYAYDRRDVTGRQLANVYAQTLGTIFTEQAKPYEVELCVAEVAHYGETKPPELYRITYDGSIADEPHFVVMGGTTEPIITALNESYTENAKLSEAVKIAVDALKAATATVRSRAASGPSTLEVAILDVNRPRRAFRRITGSALEACCPTRIRAQSGRVADRPARLGAFGLAYFSRVPVDVARPPEDHLLRTALRVASYATARGSLAYAQGRRHRRGNRRRARWPTSSPRAAGPTSRCSTAVRCSPPADRRRTHRAGVPDQPVEDDERVREVHGREVRRARASRRLGLQPGRRPRGGDHRRALGRPAPQGRLGRSRGGSTASC